MREATLTKQLRHVGFTDPSRASRLLEAPVLEHLTPEVSIFATVANPDLALLTFVRLVEACEKQDMDILAEIIRGDLARKLFAVLGMSSVLGDFLVTHPELLSSLRSWDSLENITLEREKEGALQALREMRREEELCDAVKTMALTGKEGKNSARIKKETCGSLFSGQQQEKSSNGQRNSLLTIQQGGISEEMQTRKMNALRRWYYSRLLQIAALDLSSDDPRAMVFQVSQAISAVVGGALEGALSLARESIPESSQIEFSIISMGKTGAEELNYISDVDVVYVVGDQHSDDFSLSVASKLAVEIARIVSSPAQEPPLWTLDANLRPEGKDGPLVRTLESHVNYYKRWAKGWEFQALLKARPIAGSPELGHSYIKQLWPLVWEAAGREGFVEDSRAMRRRVEQHVPAREADRQLKLGKGGLRDIEFTVQLLQLVHGRSDENLRVKPTLEALEKLRQGGYVSRRDAAILDTDYRTLRLLEHRIQLRRLRRTHVLPTGEEELRYIARSLKLPGVTGAQELENLWQSTRREVRKIHREIYYRPLLPEAAKLSPDDISLAEGPAKARLKAIGYRDPSGALRHIGALTDGISRGASIQKQLLPVMLGWFAQGPDPDAGLLAFRLLSEQMGRTSWYLRGLRDGGASAERLCLLLSTSRFVAAEIPRLAESVSWLANNDELEPRTREELDRELDSMLSRRSDPLEIVRAGRYLRRREILRTSMGQVLHLVDSVRSRAAVSHAADIAVAAGLRAAVTSACQKMGLSEPLSRYLVVSMGRMGGEEMGYASDADLIFVHDPLEGANEDEAASMATEVASALSKLLNAVDSEPPLPVDYDLRPEGRNGPLARSISSYRDYLERWAQTWEIQALLRARPCAGDKDLADEFLELITPYRYPPEGIQKAQIIEIRRMKARVETERIPRGVSPQRHLKLGRGGLSDVEWTAQLLQLMYAGQHPTMRTTSTQGALLAAAREGVLTTTEAQTLTKAWETASLMRDLNVLGTGKTRGSKIDVLAHEVDELAVLSALLGWENDKHGIEEMYLRASRQARRDVERIFFGRQ